MLNNPVIAFVNDDMKIDNEPVKSVYLKYGLWCNENGVKSLSRIEFGRELSKIGFISKVKNVDGKSIRIYSVK